MKRAWPRTRVSRGALWSRFFTPSRHRRTMRSLRPITAAMSILTGPASTPKRDAVRAACAAWALATIVLVGVQP